MNFASMTTPPISTLYSRGAEEWHRWLDGNVLHGTVGLKELTDDLCDAVGGCNMLTIDTGDGAWIAMPAPHAIRPNAVMTLNLSLYPGGFSPATGYPMTAGWKVESWGTVPVPRGEAEDTPRGLTLALAEFFEMLSEEEES
jgi:hypothetical protein